MTIMVDVHAHLDYPLFEEDLDEVIKRAKEAGVKAIIQNGINPKTNRKTLELAERYDIIKPALGLYPIDALQAEVADATYDIDCTPFDVDEEIRFIEKQKDQIIAIGEVGLDYNWIKDRCDEQKDTFSKIIRLAEKIKKPIIVHSRKAEIDILDMLESSRLKKVVLHCFCGRSSLVKRAVDDGYSFSIPANIVRDMHFQKIAAEIPTNQILTETDAPFLSPFRGKRNEPAFISESLKKISELRGLTVEETSNLIYLNYQRMFL